MHDFPATKLARLGSMLWGIFSEKVDSPRMVPDYRSSHSTGLTTIESSEADELGSDIRFLAGWELRLDYDGLQLIEPDDIARAGVQRAPGIVY